jgi:acetolactate synthase-1/2/3 large subunit
MEGAMGDRAGVWHEAPAENVGDAVVAALAAGGIDHLFFTSGSELAFLQEATAKARALGHPRPIRLITMPHEHASLNAALGFAAVAGRPAMTAAHVDAGTLHYGGALHTAWHSGLPVLITAGSPPTAYPGSMKGGRDEGGHLWMQEVYDQHAIVRNYVKWDHRMAYPDNAALTISRAIQVARSEPAGPVYLSFPKELMLLPLEGATFPTAEQLGIPRPAAPDPEAVKEIAARLVAARNPVAVVSHSGRDSRTVAPLVELCELLGIAVVDSARRAYLSFPASHPLYQPQATLKDADVVLAIDVVVPWLPHRNGPPPTAWVAAVGHDPVRLRIPTYEFTADVRVTADPLAAIQAISAAARDRLKPADDDRIAARTARLTAASKARVEATEAEASAISRRTPIAPIWVSYQVSKLLDENSLVLDETLTGGPRTATFLAPNRPGSYFANPGSSGGWSAGAALGAKLAAPDRDVIALAGDGFHQFGTPAPALWAAAHHGAPYMVVVYTNRSYSTGTSQVVSLFGKDSYAARLEFEGGYFDPPIDFAKEAEAAGAYGESVRDPAEVMPALQRGLRATREGRPAVVSVWLPRIERAS